MSYGVIYCLTNKINGKRYVGQTVQALNERLNSHCHSSYCVLLYRAIKKYGRKAFIDKVLQECDDKNSLDLAEIEWITKLNTISPNGYNLQSGGPNGRIHPDTCHKLSKSGRGRQHTYETRKKISEALTGENHPSYGKSHSIEHRLKIRNASPLRRPVVRSDGMVFPSTREAARFIGGDSSAISKCCLGKIRTHKGYGWRHQK